MTIRWDKNASDWPIPSLTSVEASAILESECRLEIERCRLYRTYFDVFVRTASPLLVDVVDAWRIDMAAALQKIHPPSNWPFRWRSRPEKMSQKALARVRQGNVGVRAGDRGRWGQMPMLKAPYGSDTALLHVEKASLQGTIALGIARCFCDASIMEVWVPGAIPETIATAAVGRPIAEIVHHELLARREYRITEVLPNVMKWAGFMVDAPLVPRPADWSLFG